MAQGGESKVQCLQVELKREIQGLQGEVTELQQTTGELHGITEEVGAMVVLHDLVKREDLNLRMGLLGVYDEAKGRWVVEIWDMPEKMWIKEENLWTEDGLKAKIGLIERTLDGEKPRLL